MSDVPPNRASHSPLTKGSPATSEHLRTIIDAEFQSTKLCNVVDYLRNLTGINMLVDWDAFSRVGVEQDFPITLALRSVSVSKCLELVLRQVSASVGIEQAVYAIIDGILEISLRSELRRHLKLIAYDIRDLLVGKSTEEREVAIREFSELVLGTVGAPEEWQRNGGDGTIVPHNGTLLIKTSAGNQEDIKELLETVRAGITMDEIWEERRTTSPKSSASSKAEAPGLAQTEPASKLPFSVGGTGEPRDVRGDVAGGVRAKAKRNTWLAGAMLMVRDYPTLSNAAIARKVGVHPSALSRSIEYRTAAALARGRNKPEGTIRADPHSKKRHIEAEGESPDHCEPASRSSATTEDVDSELDDASDWRPDPTVQRNPQRNGKARKRQ